MRGKGNTQMMKVRREDAANSNIMKINDRRARKTLHGSGDKR